MGKRTTPRMTASWYGALDHPQYDADHQELGQHRCDIKGQSSFVGLRARISYRPLVDTALTHHQTNILSPTAVSPSRDDCTQPAWRGRTPPTSSSAGDGNNIEAF